MAEQRPWDVLHTRLDAEATRFLMSFGVRRSFQSGEVVVREGEPSEQVYIILDGTADIIKDPGGHVVGSAERGAVIGEMGVFLDLRRSATVAARTELAVLELANESLVHALLHYPALTMRLLKSLAGKLNDVNTRLVRTLHDYHMLYLAGHMQRLAGTAGRDGRADVSVDLDRLAQRSGLSRGELAGALERLAQRGVVSRLRLPETGPAHLTVDTRRLHTLTDTGRPGAPLG